MSSSDYFYAEVVGQQRVSNFDRMPAIVQTILTEKIEAYTERMADIAGDLMAERLGTKTGRLNASAIQTVVTKDGKTIRGSLRLANIPYARIQEEGGTTPPHMIYPRNAKVLAFIGATGDKVIARRVYHPGGMIEGKHFMRDARRQLGPEISRGLKKAIVDGIRQNMRAQS